MDSADDAVAQDPAAEDVQVLSGELTEGFQKLRLGDGDSVMMHPCLESLGTTEPSTGMVLQATSTIQTL
jgi:aminoglycoside N3'-acetyltransferase